MRLVAKKMREKAEEMEEEKVDIRREDEKQFEEFHIQSQENLVNEEMQITSFTIMKIMLKFVSKQKFLW